MQQSQEYLKREFLYYLGDTLALLGAEEEFVKKIQDIQEKPLTLELIEEVKSFNYDQIDKVKTRLSLCHKLTVNKGG